MNSVNPAGGPLVSILVPAYNHPDFLDDCLYSILCQDYKNLEIVIKDDCSRDAEGIRNVFKKYKRLFNFGDKFRYVRNEINQGYVRNKHDGVTNYCTGKYCLIIDHDDFFVTNKVISLYVRAFASSDRVAVVSADTEDYYQDSARKSPRDIIGASSANPISEEKTVIDGNKYALCFWSKFFPLTPAVTMFDRRLALERNWPHVECNDQSIALLLSPGNSVVIFHGKLACYRIRDSSTMKTLKAEQCFASHTAIKKWVECMKMNSSASGPSLFVWRLKNVMLKDSGTIRALHDRNESELRRFLTLVRRHDLLHYIVLRYLSPQMIKYDSEILPDNRFKKVIYKTLLYLRSRISNFILTLDMVLHDSEYKPGIRGRIIRRIFGSNRNSMNK